MWNYIPMMVLSPSNHWPSNTNISFKDIYAKKDITIYISEHSQDLSFFQNQDEFRKPHLQNWFSSLLYLSSLIQRSPFWFFLHLTTLRCDSLYILPDDWKWIWPHCIGLAHIPCVETFRFAKFHIFLNHSEVAQNSLFWS